jgi:phage replication initiation protein
MITLRTGKPGEGMSLGAGVADARSAAAAPAPSPRAVTRGESVRSGELAKVDWLNSTFIAPPFSPEAFVAMVGKFVGRPCGGEAGRGLFGFAEAIRLRCYFNGSMVDIGALAYGGDSQRGRWMFQLTGKGCGLVQDWESLHNMLEELDAKITRCDLAVDFIEGEHTVDDAVQAHKDGGFTGSGRPPVTAVAGDWLDGLRGRTLYIGRGSSGKMLRVYEKGIQLGDMGSPWVRYEVQLGARDRVIPLDVLLRPTEFFAGCYPCLEGMVAEAAEKIPTTRAEAKVSLSHLLYHAKRCYGKLFDLLAKLPGINNTALVEEVRIVGIPRRLSPSGLVSGVSWPDVQGLSRKEGFK